jgi:hypothetical protein
MSPLQYQKQLRLYEARRLMLSEPVNSATAALRVWLEQLENNLGSLNTHLSPDQIKRLEDMSRVELGFAHEHFANPAIKQTISGGVEVRRK